jgi:DnaK suppressor protein
MAKAKAKANQFEPYRQALRKKQQELLETFDRDRASANAQPDDGIQDLADKAQSTYSKELNFSLSDAERITLVQIEEALERTEGGEFGFCTNCGAAISEKRLQAIPWTPFCIDCQEQQEKGYL